MRCEGMTRHGGAFTLGPVRWVQCENEAIVLLKIRQERNGKFEEKHNMPTCLGCWLEGRETDAIEILEAIPIKAPEPECSKLCDAHCPDEEAP